MRIVEEDLAEVAGVGVDLAQRVALAVGLDIAVDGRLQDRPHPRHRQRVSGDIGRRLARRAADRHPGVFVHHADEARIRRTVLGNVEDVDPHPWIGRDALVGSDRDRGLPAADVGELAVDQQVRPQVAHPLDRPVERPREAPDGERKIDVDEQPFERQAAARRRLAGPMLKLQQLAGLSIEPEGRRQQADLATLAGEQLHPHPGLQPFQGGAER